MQILQPGHNVITKQPELLGRRQYKTLTKQLMGPEFAFNRKIEMQSNGVNRLKRDGHKRHHAFNIPRRTIITAMANFEYAYSTAQKRQRKVLVCHRLVTVQDVTVLAQTTQNLLSPC
jgi:hypothetical protein